MFCNAVSSCNYLYPSILLRISHIPWGTSADLTQTTDFQAFFFQIKCLLPFDKAVQTSSTLLCIETYTEPLILSLPLERLTEADDWTPPVQINATKIVKPRNFMLKEGFAIAWTRLKLLAKTEFCYELCGFYYKDVSYALNAKHVKRFQ